MTLLYEMERTPNYRFQYSKLSLKQKRFVDEALEIIKLFPTEFQGRINFLSALKDKQLYRIRIPGAYIHYLLHSEEPVIILTQIRLLH